LKISCLCEITKLNLHIIGKLLNHMKIHLLLIFISINFLVFSQENTRNNVLIDDFRWKMVHTGDILFIYDDLERYMINKSPLESFEGYEILYDKYNIKKGEINFMWGFEVGPVDKNYQCVWILKNKKLYLSHINFYLPETYSNFKNNEQYALVEQLTGVKFDVGKASLYPFKNKKTYGLMPAIWFSDVLYVKKAMIRGKDTDLNKWTRKPYLKMVFEKGELTFMNGIVNNVNEISVNRQKLQVRFP